MEECLLEITQYILQLVSLETDHWLKKKKMIFGKILNIEFKSGKSKIISIGHRNPQGLYYSKKIIL